MGRGAQTAVEEARSGRRFSVEDLFGELDGQAFANHRELEEAVLKVLNRELTSFPPEYSYRDAIERAVRRHWLTPHKPTGVTVNLAPALEKQAEAEKAWRSKEVQLPGSVVDVDARPDGEVLLTVVLRGKRFQVPASELSPSAGIARSRSELKAAPTAE